MWHKEPKRFHMESEISDDSLFIRQRELQERLLLDDMRERGYVPVLDWGPFWSTKLNAKGRYDTVLSMFGIYVGKRKACQIMGVDGAGRVYPASTQNDKSNQS